MLEPIIDPLYYRVRKSDLGLSEPVFLSPITVPMNEIERHLYTLIVERIRLLDKEQVGRDAVTIAKLKRGRLMRVRQVLSFAALLHTVIDDYDEDLIGDDRAVAGLIARYDELETPAKITALVDVIGELRKRGQKVVVWSYFVDSLLPYLPSSP